MIGQRPLSGSGNAGEGNGFLLAQWQRLRLFPSALVVPYLVFEEACLVLRARQGLNEAKDLGNQGRYIEQGMRTRGRVETYVILVPLNWARRFFLISLRGSSCLKAHERRSLDPHPLYPLP